MPWQRSIQAAIRALKREESILRRELQTLRQKIAQLGGLAKGGGPMVGRKRATKRRLSPQGRAAISQAAKRRWRKYRAQRKKKRSR